MSNEMFRHEVEMCIVKAPEEPDTDFIRGLIENACSGATHVVMNVLEFVHLRKHSREDMKLVQKVEPLRQGIMGKMLGVLLVVRRSQPQGEVAVYSGFSGEELHRWYAPTEEEF